MIIQKDKLTVKKYYFAILYNGWAQGHATTTKTSTSIWKKSLPDVMHSNFDRLFTQDFFTD